MANVNVFWDVIETPAGVPTVLRLDGPISSEDWLLEDAVTPKLFREMLEKHPGDIDLYINSPGGEVIAASQIYTMLREHDGFVRVKIDGLAASAASVVAMAGDEVLMAPTAYMMIHNALTATMGNKDDLRHEADTLEEIDRGIRTAYRLRTGLSEAKLARMMDEETWMSAATAVTLGFADGIIGAAEEDPDEDPEKKPEEPEDRIAANLKGLPYVAWAGKTAQDALQAYLDRMKPEDPEGKPEEPEEIPEEPASDPTDNATEERLQRLKLMLLSY